MEPIKHLSPRGNLSGHASHCQQTAVRLINGRLITSGAQSKGAVKQYARPVSAATLPCVCVRVPICAARVQGDRWHFGRQHRGGRTQKKDECGTWRRMSTVGGRDKSNVTRQDKNVIWISLSETIRLVLSSRNLCHLTQNTTIGHESLFTD